MPSEKSRDKSSKHGKSERPERPKKPERSSSSKYGKGCDDGSGPDDYSKAVSKRSKPRDLTKFKSSLEDMSDKALKKYKEQNEFTDEERSLLRKERRRRDAARKAEEDDAETPEAPAAPMDFNANLSNQNNITINNTGNQDMAKVMNRMLDMLQEKGERKSKADKTVVETEEKTEKTEKTEEKKKSERKKVKFVAEEEETEQKKTTTTTTEWASEDTKARMTEGTTLDIKTDKRAQKQLAKFEHGLAERQTVSVEMMQSWVVALDPIYVYFAFFQILFMYPEPIHTRVMAFFNVFVAQLISADDFTARVRGLKDIPWAQGSDLDGLIWFLTESDVFCAFLDIIVPWVYAVYPDGIAQMAHRSGCCFYDPFGVGNEFKIRKIKNQILDELERNGGIPGTTWNPSPGSFGPGPGAFNPYYM